jgi:hypothetical protein
MVVGRGVVGVVVVVVVVGGGGAVVVPVVPLVGAGWASADDVPTSNPAESTPAARGPASRAKESARLTAAV